MKRLARLFVCGLCLACSRDEPHSNLAQPMPPAAATGQASASDALDELDQRRPVPLLPMMAHHQKENMREHLEAVQAVVAAAAASDFAKAAQAAQRMGFSEKMGRMCEHMGAGAPGFTEQALAFHHSADEIVAAAHQSDGPAVLAALAKTLGACTGCHAAFKQKPVTSLPE